MSVTISKEKSEWLVAETKSVSVCASVKNGEVKRIDIIGLKDDSIYTDIDHLRWLFSAAQELLQEIGAAQERTRPPEESNVRI